MNALRHMRLPVDDRDAPATIVKHAMAFARTLGTTLRLSPGSVVCDGEMAAENVRGGDPGIGGARGPSHGKPGAPAATTCRTGPPRYTLDAFADELADNEGVDLLDLAPMTTLVVHTAHSAYRIMVLQDTTVLLQGGPCVPEVTIAHLRGSGFGGYLLKLAWIGVGLRMEFLVDGKRFVTSTVRAITTEDDPRAEPHPPRVSRRSGAQLR